jgi:hypothetical protein
MYQPHIVRIHFVQKLKGLIDWFGNLNVVSSQTPFFPLAFFSYSFIYYSFCVPGTTPDYQGERQFTLCASFSGLYFPR